MQEVSQSREQKIVFDGAMRSGAELQGHKSDQRCHRWLNVAEKIADV